MCSDTISKVMRKLNLGTIPNAIGNLSLLTELYLQSNKLEDHIPPSLGNCKDLNGSLRGLDVLDISKNNLSGKILQFLDKLVFLEVLNLSFNDLEGEVPVEGNKRNSQPSQSSGSERFLKVSYNELLKAIDGFSTENLIGQGGFSSVYRGILNSDDGNEFKALVYELMSNGSVHDWLHSSENTSKLNLLQRINILSDVATALDYLHNRYQTMIVYGDLKPSNILLDADMVAHLGDFEYGVGSEMSSIGDIYSFGILLLEEMTGKKPIFNEGLSLHKFAYMAFPDHVIDVIDDDAIVLQRTEANAKKVEECLVATIKIGVSCSITVTFLNLGLENKPNVAGNGPTWLFDIDSLTNSMNYQPVTAGNQTNKNAGPQETNDNAGTQVNVDADITARKKNVPKKQYILMPLCSSGFSFSSTFKGSTDAVVDDAELAPEDSVNENNVHDSATKDDKDDHKKISKEKEAFRNEFERRIA
ncbi:kinase-like domain-containing protein [Tanacetum coccineum]